MAGSWANPVTQSTIPLRTGRGQLPHSDQVCTSQQVDDTLNLYDCKQNRTPQNFNIYRLLEEPRLSADVSLLCSHHSTKSFSVHPSALLTPSLLKEAFPTGEGLDRGHAFLSSGLCSVLTEPTPHLEVFALPISVRGGVPLSKGHSHTLKCV